MSHFKGQGQGHAYFNSEYPETCDRENIIYLINGITILPTDKGLDLGIITDSDLSYSSHIDHQ